MAKFKIGDRVQVTANNRLKGYTGTIKENDSTMPTVAFDKHVNGHDCAGRVKDGHGYYISESELKLTNKTTLFMSIKNTLKRLTRTEPQKNFIEIGFLDENEEVTNLGKEALVNILFANNEVALKEVADQLLKEKRAEEAKKK